MACTPANPCCCLGTYTAPANPVTDCFRLGNIVVDPCDSVIPCGETGLVEFDCFDFTKCDSTVEFQIVSNSGEDKITINSITEAGINFTTTANAKGNDRIEIVFYAKCPDEDCNFATDYGTVVLYIKDACKGVLCGSDQTCNECTGVCEDNADLCDIEAGDPNTNLGGNVVVQ